MGMDKAVYQYVGWREEIWGGGKRASQQRRVLKRSRIERKELKRTDGDNKTGGRRCGGGREKRKGEIEEREWIGLWKRKSKWKGKERGGCKLKILGKTRR